MNTVYQLKSRNEQKDYYQEEETVVIATYSDEKEANKHLKALINWRDYWFIKWNLTPPNLWIKLPMEWNTNYWIEEFDIKDKFYE